jgi:aminoglycoside 6'-N-acetyltransferase I
VEGIYVVPATRGTGVARRLMSAAEDWCRAHDCREMATDAELDNLAAQKFHRSMGFSESYRIVEFRKDL